MKSGSNNKYNTETLVTRLGRAPELHEGHVNPPIFNTSTVLFPDLKSYQQADELGLSFSEYHEYQQLPDFSYGIQHNPTTLLLQHALSELEGGEQTLLFPTGLNAIAFVFSEFLTPGDHLLMIDSAYGPARRYALNELSERGVTTSFFDPMVGSDIRELIRPNTKLIYLESPGSLTFEVSDIGAICAVAREQSVATMMDNTWATPVFFQPLKHNVDISMSAVTKYLSGHSDLLMGSITCREPLAIRLAKASHHLGARVSPFESWLVLRGLRTLSVRLKAHEKGAIEVAEWLAKRPEVDRVLHPAFSSCPGHENWKRDFSGSTGLFSFLLNPVLPKGFAESFINSLKLFGIGASWGGFNSLVLPIHPTRSVQSPIKAEQEGIRLHIGLENIQDLLEDLEQGFDVSTER